MNMKKVFAASLMTVSLSACFEPEVSSTVLIMGDSIMQELSDEFSAGLQARDYAPMVVNNSIGGMPLVANGATEYWVGRITSIRSKVELDTIFVSGLTNDTNYYTQLGNDVVTDMYTELPSGIDEIMSAVDSQTEVYWLAPNEWMATNTVIPDVGVAVDILEDAELRWDNLTIYYVQDVTSIDEDWIHLSDKGEVAVSNQMISILGY